MSDIFSKVFSIGLPILAVIIVLCILASGYVKAPPDMVYIITGLRKKPKLLQGRAGVKIPFLEKKDVLLARQISVDIKTNGYIPTKDFIGVDIDAVAKICLKTDPEGIQLASKNFLNMGEESIADALKDSLQGNMREIIGTISLKEICNDRKKFGDEVQEKAQKDMDALGVQIISCNIQRVEDEKNLINALGQDNMAQIQKDASIAKANADKEVAIAEAQAKKEANDAQVMSSTQIAEKKAELAKRQAELKRDVDTQTAQAEAAKAIEAENQRKLRDVAATNADIANAQAQTELKQQQIALKEYELDALVRKQADADKYAAERNAEAKMIALQRQAEADRYKLEQQAEATRYAEQQKAEAAKFAAQQDAEARKAQADAAKYAALAEAEGIKAKGDAEAEAILKKAEAQKKMGEASVLEMYLAALPQIVEAASAPLSQVDRITMYGDNNNSKLVGDVMRSANQIMEGVKEATGIDLTSIINGLVSTNDTSTQ